MNKIEKFLKKVKDEEKDQYFILYKFYKMPESLLGGSDESTIEEYYQFGSIKQLVLNNTFFEFLKLCLESEDFCQKLDYNLLRKIRFILFDSITFQKNYTPLLEDPHLREWCQNKVPLRSTYSKKYNVLELMEVIEQYRQYGWIYDLELDPIKRECLNVPLIKEDLSQSGYLLDMYYERYILPEEERRNMLERIRYDDYTNPGSCFLTNRSGTEFKIFKSLVCDNDFLQIVETELLPKELPQSVKEHIIEILEISIDFKTMNSIYENFSYYYNELGKEKIKNYDYQKAKKLLEQLQTKHSSKIVQFYHF